MERIIAYCGLVCSECEAYVATQANDQGALEEVAAQWRAQYNAPGITVEDVICDGCLDNGKKCHHCAECEIRACGVERGVVNCARCDDYACEQLEGFFAMVPDARDTLNGLRAAS
jgi:hypothetical protein